jgi:hypothetical protein
MKKPIIEIAIIIISVAVVFAAAKWYFHGLATGFGGFGSQKFNYSKVISNYFDVPIKKVQIIKGGGTAWLGHDVWIKFTSNDNIILKNQSEYKDQAVKEANNFFLEQCPEDKDILSDTMNLKCLYFTDEKKTWSNGKYLLYHNGKKLYYFRSWNHS